MKKILIICIVLIISGCKNRNELVCTGDYSLNNEDIKIEYIFHRNGEKISNFDVKLTFKNKEEANKICEMYKEVNKMLEKKENFTCKKNYIIYVNANNNEKYDLDNFTNKSISEITEFLTNHSYKCKEDK